MKKEQNEQIKVQTSDKKVVGFGVSVIAIVFGIFGVWAGFAPLDSAAVAVGKVAVADNKKIIQHLEGGVVDKIYVKDGDKVKKGDVLLEVRSTRAKAELEILTSDYKEAIAIESRLISERDDLEDMSVPDELKNDMPIFNSQKSVFETRKKLRNDEKIIMRQRENQLSKQIDGLKSLISSRKQRVLSLDEEIKEWQKLFEEQLTDKIKLRDLKREKIMVEGEISSQEAEISRLRVQINEVKSQQILKDRAFKEEVLSKLQEVKLKISDLNSRKTALKEQLSRTKILSPVDGVVVEMKVHTIGGVIGSGAPILSIVPEEENLIVEAKMQITDIDKVFVGLKADIRFSAFKLQMVHVIEGEITYVSADSIVDRVNGMPYYLIKAKVTNEGKKYLKENKFFLVPGMPAEVMVKTGERTVLSYIINPFLNMFTRAFNED